MHPRARGTIDLRLVGEFAELRPMLASPAPSAFQNQNDFAYEFKWDGVRALCFHDGHQLYLRSRNGNDITACYPELQALSLSLGSNAVILDGEIIALDEQNYPSFHQLQNRMHVRHPSPELVRQTPVFLVVFDVLYRAGKWLIDQPYEDRRATLEGMKLNGPAWRITPMQVHSGEAMLNVARQQHLEGLIAKRIGSIYERGHRSTAWLKIKLTQSQEFVIGGWIPEANDPHRIGSLLIGYYDQSHRLHFAGGLGTGFTDTEHHRLFNHLKKIEQDDNPFVDPTGKRGVHFVRPNQVVEVEYCRWPPGGMVQHAAYKGLRNDKDAHSVVREHL